MKRLAEFLLALGPAGMFVVAAIDSAIPVAGIVDGMLLVLSAGAPEQAWLLAVLASVGSVLGTTVLFWIARRGGEAYLARHTVSARGARFRQWFQHYGLLTVFSAAVVPIIPTPLKLFIICAGASGVSPGAFVATMLAARLPRYFSLAHLGRQMRGDALSYLKAHGWHLAGIAVGVFLALFLAVRWMDRRRSRA